MTRYARRVRLTVAVLWSLTTAAAGPLPVRAGGGLPAIDAFHVGRHHLASGNREAALDSFNDSLRLNPQFVQAYVARGKLLAEMGQHTAALADLNFALHLQPTHTEGFAYRGFALLALDRPEEALADFNQALRLDPSYARVYYLRGQALQTLGDAAGAETGRAMALRLDPTIEIVQTASAVADGAIVDRSVILAGPTLPERTSVMASSEVAAPPRDRKREGNVIRYDQHPMLSKLTSPTVSQPVHREPYPRAVRPKSPAPEYSTAARPLTKTVEILPLPVPTELPTAKEAAPAQEVDAATPIATPTPIDVTSETLSPSLVVPDVAPLIAADTTPLAIPVVELPGVELSEALPETLPTIAAEPIVAAEPVVIETVPGTIVRIDPTIVVDEPPPSASAILNGLASAAGYVGKPSPEASAERMSAAIESAKQAVVHRETEAYVSDMPTTEPVAPNNEQPATVEPAILPLPPALADTALVASSPLAGDAAVDHGADADLLTELDAAIRQTPGDPALRCRRGIRRLEHGHYAGAAADFDEALKIDPALIDALYGRARAKYLAGRPAEAVEDYTAVIRLDDQHAYALIERGHCFAQLGRRADSDEDRSAALALNPSLAKTGPKYDDVAMVSDADDAGGSAVVVSDEHHATPIAVPQALGILFHAGPVVTAAAPALQAAASPGVVRIGDVASMIPSATTTAAAVAESPLDVAVRELSSELEKTPGDAQLYVLRAQALLSLGRAEDAADDLTIALRIDPKAEKALQLRSRVGETLARPTAQ